MKISKCTEGTSEMDRDLAMDNNEIIMNSLLQTMRHPFVGKYATLAKVDEDKIMFLQHIFRQHSVEEKQERAYIEATMFVQSALDTHDFVSEGDMYNDQMRKNRQLTVLSGDYCSSLYYYILAKIGEISTIKLLAIAIEEINEEKMKLYNQDYQSIEELIESFKTVETNLVTAFAKHYACGVEETLIKEFFFLKRYVVEEQSLLNGQFSLLFHSLLPVLFTKRELKKRSVDSQMKEKQNNQMIEAMATVLKRSKEKISTLPVTEEIKQRIEVFTKKIS